MIDRSRTHESATRYILYGRKSNEREDRQIRSLGDQSKLAYEEANRISIHIVQEISEAKSAKRPGNRAGFQEMIDWIEAGKADGILCWHPDRLARNAVDGGWILDLLDRGKLKDLHFLSFHFDNSPEGKFALGMVFSQAKYQVDKLSNDVIRGMREMRQEGGFPHYVPEGYKNIQLESGKKSVVMDSERFPLLRRAVDLMLEGIYSPASVRRMLNAWGYRTRTTKGRVGGPISEGGFYRLFKNPFYTGLCKAGDSYYPGTHPPLMSESEFQRLRAIIVRSSGPALRKHSYTYAGGLFVCGRCGCHITATLSKGRHKRGSWVYYHCTNKKEICDKCGTRQEVVEASVLALLERLTIPAELESILIDMVEAALQEGKQSDITTIGVAARRLTEAQGERTRLVSLLAKGVLDADDFTPARNALDTEIRALEEQVKWAGGRQEAERGSARNAVSFAVHAREAFEIATPDVKRHIVRMLSVHRVLTPGNPLLEPHPYLEPFLELNTALGRFKPSKNGSGCTKTRFITGKLTYGAPNINRIEPADLTRYPVSLCEMAIHKLALSIINLGEFFPELQANREVDIRGKVGC